MVEISTSAAKLIYFKSFFNRCWFHPKIKILKMISVVKRCFWWKVHTWNLSSVGSSIIGVWQWFNIFEMQWRRLTWKKEKNLNRVGAYKASRRVNPGSLIFVPRNRPVSFLKIIDFRNWGIFSLEYSILEFFCSFFLWILGLGFASRIPRDWDPAPFPSFLIPRDCDSIPRDCGITVIFNYLTNFCKIFFLRWYIWLIISTSGCWTIGCSEFRS